MVGTIHLHENINFETLISLRLRKESHMHSLGVSK